MNMKQLEIYKKALIVLEKSRAVHLSKSVFDYWTAETYFFGGLCRLIRDITSEDSRVLSRFKRDSETVLSRKLHENDLWFTSINEDEPKARQERLEHLKKLIKLYEDEEK